MVSSSTFNQFIFLNLITIFGLTSVVVSHDAFKLLYEPVPGYLDCSQDDPRLPEYTMKPCRGDTRNTGQTITIACVGDSITAGGWPQIMQSNLNVKYGANVYNVINFGECGSTMQRHADSPYVNRTSWPIVLKTNATIIIIMLGTNDAKTTANNGPANWEDNGKTGYDEYLMSYAWMVSQFNSMPSKPDVYVTTPVPNYINGVYGMNQTVINHIFPAKLPEIANELTKHLSLDIFDCMGGVNLTHPELIADGCHPNAAGYIFLAQCFQTALNL